MARCLPLLVLLLAGCATTAGIERRHYGAWETDIGYTQVVQVGKTLHLSGVTSSGATMEDQLRGVYDKIVDVLDDYGVGTDRVIREVAYTRDIEALKSQIPVRLEYYPHGKFPMATWVQIDRLFQEDFMLEIEVTAVLP